MTNHPAESPKRYGLSTGAAAASPARGAQDPQEADGSGAFFRTAHVGDRRFSGRFAGYVDMDHPLFLEHSFEMLGNSILPPDCLSLTSDG